MAAEDGLGGDFRCYDYPSPCYPQRRSTPWRRHSRGGRGRNQHGCSCRQRTVSSTRALQWITIAGWLTGCTSAPERIWPEKFISAPHLWIGIGSSVCQCTRIGIRATVGAGAVVTEDVPDGITVVGVPARPQIVNHAPDIAPILGIG